MAEFMTMTTELEELIEFYKLEAAATRINYPELSEKYTKTAEYLEELQKLREAGVARIEVKND